MLILTQKAGETVFITLPDGTEITVTVMTLDRGRARIGYEAPRNIVVDRQEIHDRKLIQAEVVSGNG